MSPLFWNCSHSISYTCLEWWRRWVDLSEYVDLSGNDRSFILAFSCALQIAAHSSKRGKVCFLIGTTRDLPQNNRTIGLPSFDVAEIYIAAFSEASEDAWIWNGISWLNMYRGNCKSCSFVNSLRNVVHLVCSSAGLHAKINSDATVLAQIRFATLSLRIVWVFS